MLSRLKSKMRNSLPRASQGSRNVVLQARARFLPVVAIHPVGLSDHQGTIDIQIPIDEHGVEHDASASMGPHVFTDARAEVVPLRTLDSYGFESATFLKSDAGDAGWFLDHGVLRSSTYFDPVVDLPSNGFEGGIGRYINNFPFLANERLSKGRFVQFSAAFPAS